jgi:HAMP domain-containing protein
LNRLGTGLRIGEKIGLSFGAVALILLGAIWYYHLNLVRVVDNYQELQSVYGERQSLAFSIESRLSDMLSAAERFLATRDTGYAAQARAEAAALAEQIALLADIDAASGRTAEQLSTLNTDFSARFDAIVEAWRRRGLDENLGLQGAFRDAAHELEDRAGQYNVDRPYLLLLQLRRREKDLGLRRDPSYQQQVYALLDEMTKTVNASNLSPPIKQALAAELSTYRSELDAYAGIVLSGEEIDGGKGPFRDAAHRIEDLLTAHYIPGLETQVLQLRRREKDYLLRGDQRYVAMVERIASGIRDRIDASSVAEVEQAQLLGLLDGYQRDFRALVEQDRLIHELTAAMYDAAARITPLVQENLTEANALMQRMSTRIADDSAARAQASLIAAATALALGTLFAVLITGRIVRPVDEMAGMLDRLTRENPTERIPTDPKGRDEINAMAIALNTMADHKATFFHWWRTSMQEAIALRDRHQAKDDEERVDAEHELHTAAVSRLAQINALKTQLLAQTERISHIAERLDSANRHSEDGAALRNAAAGIRTLISVLDED